MSTSAGDLPSALASDQTPTATSAAGNETPGSTLEQAAPSASAPAAAPASPPATPTPAPQPTSVNDQTPAAPVPAAPAGTTAPAPASENTTSPASAATVQPAPAPSSSPPQTSSGSEATPAVAPSGTGDALPAAAPTPSSNPAEPIAPELNPVARINTALRKGDKSGALKIADEFLVTQPRDAQVRFLRAVVLGDLNRQEDAATALESLTEDFPELPEPYNNLAVIRANQGKFAAAEHYLQLAIAARPNYVTAQENLGDLYISMAAASYEQAVRLAPANGTLRTKLSLTRELSGKLRAAR